MAVKRCIPCGGSGKQMGGGMIIVDCKECSGSGSLALADNDIGFAEMSATPSYKSAIKGIMALDDSLTEKDAEELFRAELEKPAIKANPKLVEKKKSSRSKRAEG